MRSASSSFPCLKYIHANLFLVFVISADASAWVDGWMDVRVSNKSCMDYDLDDLALASVPKYSASAGTAPPLDCTWPLASTCKPVEDHAEDNNLTAVDTDQSVDGTAKFYMRGSNQMLADLNGTLEQWFSILIST